MTLPREINHLDFALVFLNNASPLTFLWAHVLNKKQKKFLIDHFGKESIFHQSFAQDSKVDVGTKISLLEDALTQLPETFILTMDKFVAKLIAADSSLTKDQLTLVYGLKLINDLQFNTTPAYIRTQVRLKAGETQYPTAMGFHLNTDKDDETQKFLVRLVNDCKHALIKKNSWPLIKQQMTDFAQSPVPTNVSFWRLPSQNITEVMTLNCMAQHSTFAFFSPKVRFDACIKQTEEIENHKEDLNERQRAALELFSGVLSRMQDESKRLTAQIKAGM